MPRGGERSHEEVVGSLRKGPGAGACPRCPRTSKEASGAGVEGERGVMNLGLSISSAPGATPRESFPRLGEGPINLHFKQPTKSILV